VFRATANVAGLDGEWSEAGGALVKALNGELGRGEELEEACDSNGFEGVFRACRQCGKPNIPVALHHFLKSAEEQVGGPAGELIQVGAIENEARAFGIRVQAEVGEKGMLSLCCEIRWNLVYPDRSFLDGHESDPPTEQLCDVRLRGRWFDREGSN
jgi:hypothetical protein